MIEAKSLTRSFGLIKAADSVSFKVEKGDILGFLGPNGAGKSTTMRMLTGYLTPSSGDAFIDGDSVTKNPLKTKTKTGYLSETSPLYSDMTVTEFLDFCAETRGFRGRQKKIKRDEAIEKCFIKDVASQQIHTLSKGYRQRVSFAQSILHDPEYLILDEPTDGLDPNQKNEVREMIKSMSHEKGIILSTHILEEAIAVCSRAVIISNGRLIEDSTPEDLMKKDPDYGCIKLRIDYSGCEKNITELIKSTEGVKDFKLDKAEKQNRYSPVKIYPDKKSPTSVSQLMGRLEKNLSSYGCQINSISVDQGDLTKVFQLLTSN